MLVGIVQFTNYLRPLQFIVHVSLINERVELLADKIKEIEKKSEGQISFDSTSSSTVLYNQIEVFREIFGRIWHQHKSLSDCFGFSMLVVTLNTFLGIAFTLYISILTKSKDISIEFVTHLPLHTFHIAIMFVGMIYTCERSDAVVSYTTANSI